MHSFYNKTFIIGVSNQYMYILKITYRIFYILFMNCEHFINIYQIVQTVKPSKNHKLCKIKYSDIRF